MGTVVIGKVESGKCQKGDLLLVMPNRVSQCDVVPRRSRILHNWFGLEWNLRHTFKTSKDKTPNDKMSNVKTSKVTKCRNTKR